MFRLLLSLNLFLCLCLPSWASPETQVYTLQAETRIQTLNQDDALARYHAEKIDPQIAAAENLIPLGFGSFRQGDFIGGSLIALIDAVGLGILAFGVMGDGGYGWGVMIGVGWFLVAYALGRVVGAISPGFHADLHNEALRKKLGLSEAQLQHQTQSPQDPERLPVVNLSYTF